VSLIYLNEIRLLDIGKYIDGGGYFPNSIIVNILTKKQGLKFEQASVIENDSGTAMGVLHLPKTYKSVFIIDGQHRLYGYSTAKSESNHTVPVVAFLNLSQNEQAKIFVKINRTQKSVQPNLLRSIMADFNWKSDHAGDAITALKTRLLTHLNLNEFSPFYKRIVLADENESSIKCLTLVTILQWGLGSKLGFFGKVRGKNLIKTGYLTDVSYDDTLKKSIDFFNGCFCYIAGELKDQWDAGKGDGGFIAMNVGVSAIMRTLDHLLDHLVRNEKLQTEQLSGQELTNEIITYLIPVVDFIKGLDATGLKQLRGHLGSGAPGEVTMHFLSAIHNEFENFNPEGLEQWIKESTGEYNKLCYDLGNGYIEPMMHQFVLKKLSQEYGEKAFWAQGVPADIQKDCSAARIDSGTDEPDWNFLNTIHYRAIVDRNWPLFGGYFTPPGMDNANKGKKLSWLVQLNKVRQRYSHPQRLVLTEAEYKFLKETYEWLTVKLID